MARRPQVRYFESRNAYFCQFRGRQHKLADGPEDHPNGPNYTAALKAFTQLMAMGNVHQAKDGNTVRVVLETYLQHVQARLKASTLQLRQRSFRFFCQRHGETAVGALTPFAVWEFIAQMRRPRPHHAVNRRAFAWGDGAAGEFLKGLSAAFNWSVKAGLLTRNPLAGIEKPAVRNRSRDCVLTPEQHQRILAGCKSATFRRLIVALENTGARPGELTAATAADWDDGLGALVYHADARRRTSEFRHKTAGRGKDRVIRFTGEALALVRDLARQHPTGPLFRNQYGRDYSGQSVQSCFQFLRKRLDLPSLTAYSYRHTLATRWLLAGAPIDVLAELLGNSPHTIRQHYAHLCTDQPAIRRQLEAFKGIPAAETQSGPVPPAAGPRLHRA